MRAADGDAARLVHKRGERFAATHHGDAGAKRGGKFGIVVRDGRTAEDKVWATIRNMRGIVAGIYGDAERGKPCNKRR